MREEDLELLITTDDPGEDTLGEDNFKHPQAENTLEYWLGQPFTGGSSPTNDSERVVKKEK